MDNDEYNTLWDWCKQLQDRIEKLEERSDAPEASGCTDPSCHCRREAL